MGRSGDIERKHRITATETHSMPHIGGHMHRIGYATGGAIALAIAALPQAANAADTTVTFGVTAGTLTISAPTAVSLGNGAPGGTITGSFSGGGVTGVTVTDARGLNPAPWTATVSSTDFSPTAGTGAIPAADVNYTPNTATFTGDGTFTAGTAGPLSSGGFTAYSHTGGTGGNTANWIPTLLVNVPVTAHVTTYTGIVTHSVVAS
ncbi:hypothetical protein NE236_16035 [Actinoallomurus purpureus]|uniref:hypothetical protein n=1 Tax=Actinoallomurus purpureus TaxID=478114 RepID=UPI0020926172|nr:hypothetical protein [Actinoallomurus purpureus]MCO6006496.1 hypothetical protein [Actinoallomurus purpureus]